MTENKDKIKKLYDTFVADGYDMESEDDFRKNMSDAKKRKAAYDALVNDGYDMEPFDVFENNIGYGIAGNKSLPNGTGKHAQQVVYEYDRSAGNKPRQQGMSKAQKEDMLQWASDLKRGVASDMGQTSNKLKYSQERAKNPLKVSRSNLGVGAAPIKIGENRNVVETGNVYDPKDGTLKPTYMTEAGNEYANRGEADWEQGLIDEARREKEREEERKNEEEAKMQHDPSLWETVTKASAPVLRAPVPVCSMPCSRSQAGFTLTTRQAARGIRGHVATKRHWQTVMTR